MKSIALIIVFVFASTFCPSCKTTGGPTPTVVQRVERDVYCTVGKIPEEAPKYIAAVTSCLAGDYVGCLAKIAAVAGPDVVACDTAQVVAEASKRAALAGPGVLVNQEALVHNGRAYLEMDGARVHL